SLPEKEWTVLVYMGGDNNLRRDMGVYLQDLELVGSSDQTNIVAQFDRGARLLDYVTGEWRGARRFYVTKSDQPQTLDSKLLHTALGSYVHDVKKIPTLKIPTPGFLTRPPFQPSAEQVAEYRKAVEERVSFLKKWMEGYPARHFPDTYENALKAAEQLQSPSKPLLAEFHVPMIGLPGETKGIRSPVLEDLGGIDMSARKSLADFVEWGMKNYPARHTLLVVKSHGSGFRSVIQDSQSASPLGEMPVAEFRGALEDAAKKVGKKPDVLAFDACYMGQAEVAYELRDTADYMVAAPSPEYLFATPLGRILRDLDEREKKGETVMPKALAETMVEYAKHCFASALDDAPLPVSYFTPTQTALDLTKMGVLRDAVDHFADSLIQADLDKELFRDLASGTLSYGITSVPARSFRDLGDFALAVGTDSRIASPALKEAAGRVLQALDTVVMSEEHNDPRSAKGLGLSIYLSPGAPRVGKLKALFQKLAGISSPDSRYFSSGLQFLKDTRWDEMLQKYSGKD
ncbi:MAG: hypothetical protein HYU64_02760, partial [Armatimonadetes bacterium]|nr:hypothetical protein [Armatimonadota bacterium]